MIRVLDSFISDKIAAGEVIERPVSAVKELIENSIDAAASSIIVEVKGASSYIRITDNGCGIASDEIETAFLRHATSKISKVTDLDNIRSLGFRGEALASISAVSRLTIVSRTKDEISGTKLVLHAGRLISREKLGSNTGTTIVVEDLFYNTPARRKFMKSDAREASAIIELVQQYAICYPGIRFMMINNSVTLFSTDGNGDAASVIRTLYPDNAHSSLIPVTGEGVSGYVSDPGTVLNSKRGQLFYVNGRLVSSKIIEKALTDGYSGRIFSGFPIGILFIEADPFDLDVNIHPGKREILFLHPEDVSSRISSAVSDALNSARSVPKPEIKVRDSFNAFDTETITDTEHDNSFVNDSDDKDSYVPLSGNTSTVSPAYSSQTSIKDYLGSIDRDASQELKHETESMQDTADNSGRIDFNSLISKGYVFDTYIIMQADETLYVFDQHAAHERIFYEKLMQAYNSADKIRQPLITPIVLNVSADVYELRDEILEALTSMGYDIDDFGGGSFIIREIPSYMKAQEAREFAAAFCDSSEISQGLNSTVIDKLIMKSCKSAVKGGDSLSAMEIKSLIKELSECDNPYSCPHGRPTFIKITRYDAERAFKRK